MAGTTSYQFGIQYGASTSFNTTNLPVSNGQMYFVTQGSGTNYVLGYVDLNNNRYAIGAPIPDTVPTAVQLSHSLTMTLNGKALSYNGGTEDVFITDTFYIGSTATASNAANSNLTNGNIFLNRSIATRIGDAAASTTVANLFKIVGSGGATVTYTSTDKTITINTPTYSTLPNPQALSWGTKSYTGADPATILLSDLGGLAATKGVKSVAMDSSGVITITFEDNTTKTSTAPTSWGIKATTAGTADNANKVNTPLTWNGHSYDGSSDSTTEITGSDIKALANGLPASSIDWDGYVLDISHIPTAAQERLFVTAKTGTQTDLDAATAFMNGNAVEAGDVIQVDGGQMFFVYQATASSTKTLKAFSAGVASQATTVSGSLIFKAGPGDSGSSAGTSWNGNGTTINVGYQTVGAAPAGSVISSAAFGGTGNRTLTLTKGDSTTVTAALPAAGSNNAIGIDISGKATTAGTADQVAGTLTFKVVNAAASVTGTVGQTALASYNGDSSPNITYTPNSAITQGNVIGWLTLGGANPVAITSGMFWTTF